MQQYMKLEDRIKRISKRLLPAIAAVVIVGGAVGVSCNAIYKKYKHDTALYSPEFLDCMKRCKEQYDYGIRVTRETDKEHNCSAEWLEQELDSSYDYFRSCEEGCEKLKWSEEK